MIKALIWLWLVSAAIITGGALLIFVAVHQTYREGANDPQMQMSQDLAKWLTSQKVACDHTTAPTEVLGSLTPFVDVYDANGQPATVCLPATQPLVIGAFNGQIPKLPAGVFDYTKTYGHDRFTWQPNNGSVRFAAFVTYYKSATNSGGFVLAARDLREVEARARQLGQTVFAAWFIGILVTTLGFLFAARASRRN